MGEPSKEVGGLAPSKQSSPPVGAILRHNVRDRVMTAIGL